MIVVAVLGALWASFAAVGYFRNVSYYNRQDATTLAVIAIILGAVYAFIAVVECFGIWVGVTRKIKPARIFAWLTAVVFILVVAAGLAKVIIHYTLKNQIIDACVSSVDGGTYVFSGFWGPITSGTIDRASAEAWCNRSWNRGSWSEIIAFLCIAFLAAMFASISFGFYRQVLDPASVLNAWRTGPPTGGMMPTHYAPPYAGGYVQPAPPYQPGPAPNNYWVPPPGPPPATNDANKPPGYGNEPGTGGGQWGYGAGTREPEVNKDPFAGGEPMVGSGAGGAGANR